MPIPSTSHATSYANSFLNNINGGQSPPDDGRAHPATSTTVSPPHKDKDSANVDESSSSKILSPTGVDEDSLPPRKRKVSQEAAAVKRSKAPPVNGGGNTDIAEEDEDIEVADKDNEEEKAAPPAPVEVGN